MRDVEYQNMGLSNTYIATLAAMDGSGGRRRTRATALAVLAVLILAPAPAATAQSAGDRQYSDPLVGGGRDRSGAQTPPAGSGDGSNAPAPSAPTPATPSAPAPETPPATAGETAATPSATLPRTGADAPALAGLGLALIAIGALGLATARRRGHARE
jgi:LPXTG-motif cell wall-anchored protein